MNSRDWIFLILALVFLVGAIAVWLIYAWAKREFIKKIAKQDDENDESERHQTLSILDIYAHINLLNNSLNVKKDELYNERKNMTCEELGSLAGERFAKKYEHFSVVVEMMNDVQAYIRRSLEAEKND